MTVSALPAQYLCRHCQRYTHIAIADDIHVSASPTVYDGLSAHNAGVYDMYTHNIPRHNMSVHNMVMSDMYVRSTTMHSEVMHSMSMRNIPTHSMRMHHA